MYSGAKCTEIYCKRVCAVDNLNAIVWERQWIRWTTFMLLVTYYKGYAVNVHNDVLDILERK